MFNSMSILMHVYFKGVAKYWIILQWDTHYTLGWLYLASYTYLNSLLNFI